METGLLLLWSITGSILDIRKKSVPIFFLVVGIGCSLICYLFRAWMEQSGTGSSLWLVTQRGLLSLLPGGLLLLFSLFTKGAIGMADGLFLMAPGLLLGAAQTFAVFVGGIFAAGLFSGAGLFFRRLRRDSRLPLLPFFTGALIFLLICQIPL